MRKQALTQQVNLAPKPTLKFVPTEEEPSPKYVLPHIKVTRSQWGNTSSSEPGRSPRGDRLATATLHAGFSLSLSLNLGIFVELNPEEEDSWNVSWDADRARANRSGN